ncbi:MAG: hypothetical protein LBK41_06635 [Clostridiales bacterium]|jgi:uncharacterized membrane protein YcgQ (UPF0703/DUF1980 family)|nr:hypothetical protein [Clostridiales bacterium]
MRKVAIPLIVCVLFALGGCQDNAAANPRAKNDNGTTAVSLSETQTAEPNAVPAHTALPETNAVSAGGVVEIKEKMFIAQTNDVYYNAEDYLGKTIKYEGIFNVYEEPELGAEYYSVIRYGPGCCGIDANAGFEVAWGNDYPEQNDWVEAVGVLEEYEEDGYKYLRLALSSLTVLTARGAEYVSQ